MKLTAIIIARNEEKNISACIKSLDFADEIILIDNGSEDATAKIARKLKARIFPAVGLNFSQLRNLGQEKAKYDWLFYLDADERVSRELSSAIKNGISEEHNIAAFTVTRVNYYFGKKWPYAEKMIRLIRKDKLIRWRGALHETPEISGKIGSLNYGILHYTHNDISSMVDKTNEWSTIEARLRFYKNHPPVVWWRFFRVMLTAFWQSFIIQGGWKAGTYGVVESIYQSFSIFITYAKLWEKQQSSGK